MWEKRKNRRIVPSNVFMLIILLQSSYLFWVGWEPQTLGLSPGPTSKIQRVSVSFRLDPFRKNYGKLTRPTAVTFLVTDGFHHGSPVLFLRRIWTTTRPYDVSWPSVRWTNKVNGRHVQWHCDPGQTFRLSTYHSSPSDSRSTPLYGKKGSTAESQSGSVILWLRITNCNRVKITRVIEVLNV